MRFRFFIIVSILLLLTSMAGAMPYFRHLDAGDGLAHPSVMAICQDSLGRIWFGTEDGVSVYDGNRIFSLKPYEFRGGEMGYSEGVVTSMMCDSTGDVFFLAGHQLVRHGARTGEVRTVLEGDIRALHSCGGRASVAFGTEILSWNPETSAMEKSGSLPFPDVTLILNTSYGRTFIATSSGLFALDGGQNYQKISSIGDLFGFFESSCGEVWTGSKSSGLLRLGKDLSLVRYTSSDDSGKGFTSDNVRAVSEDTSGNIWFGTFKGLFRYDPSLDAFFSFHGEDREGGFTQSSVYSVFVDRDGFLWAGTYYGGVSYTDTGDGSTGFYPATSSGDGLSNPVVGHIAEGPGGRIWICTEGGGINSLELSSGRINRYPGQPLTNVKWFEADPSGDMLYIATNGQGLFRMNVPSGRFERIISPGDGNSPFAIINVVAMHGDYLYLSTDSGVYVHSMTSGKDSLLFGRQEGVRYVHEVIAEGRLWLCSSKVVVFDLASKKLEAEYPVVSDGVQVRPMRLMVMPSGEVLVSTFGHGLFRLEDGAFRPFAAGSGIGSGYRLALDGKGRILVSSGDGIHVLDPSGTPLRTFLPGKDLPLKALVMDSGLAVSSDGTVYAGGTNGLVSLRPGHTRRPGIGNIYFSELYIDGTPVHPYDRPDILAESLPFVREVRVKGPQVSAGLYFSSRRNMATLNWTEFEYRIRNSEGWNDLAGPMIPLPDIGVGRYDIGLRDKATGEMVGSLTLRVVPRAYASWWAKLLYVLLAAGVGFMLLRMLRLRRESARIQEMNETKMRFFTTMSHELRTPLTLMISQIDSIFRSFRLPPMVSHKMGRVKAQATQMNHLVTELIDFRKMEQNLVTLHVAKTPVNAFVSDIADRFREICSEKDIELLFSPSADSPQAWIDPYQMQKVLMNLIFNAVKFTPEKGRIDLSVRSTPNGPVRISVGDTGQGISEKDLPHIFERFFRASESDAGGVPGSGIGLPLAKDIVEKHHGTISVESRLGEGSLFTVELLPGKEHFEGTDGVVVEDSSVPADIEAVPMAVDASATEGRSTVLIAEDNEEMASLLKELFSVQYRVILASDGVEALEKVKSDNPDLVVSDVMMPRMDGTELCAAIKGDARTSSIPVVLLTALEGTSRQLGGILKGADDYITKPFDSRMLLARCNNLLKLRGSGSKPSGEGKLSGSAANIEDKEFLDRIQKIVEDNISDTSLDNDSLASMMHMSRSRFYTRFKAVTSGTPNDYLMSVRLSKACSLLMEQPGLSIAEVAERLGFSTQNYFCHRFKIKYGVSPSQYRRTH